jgi:hypothetical protein
MRCVRPNVLKPRSKGYGAEKVDRRGRQTWSGVGVGVGGRGSEEMGSFSAVVQIEEVLASLEARLDPGSNRVSLHLL